MVLESLFGEKMKKKMIYITPRFPWPLVTGDRIRCFNLLRELSVDYDITLIVLSGGHGQECAEVNQFISDLVTFDEKSIVRKVKDIAFGLASGLSLQEALFLRPELESSLSYLCADVALVHLLRAAPNKSFISARRYILDMCDPVSLTYLQTIKLGSKFSIWYWISILEFWFTNRREKEVLNEYERVFLHSAHDVKVAGLKQSNVRVSTMGLSLSHLERFFDRDVIGRNILFVGNLDYYPNHSGLEWFITEVFQKLPSDYALHIIGGGGKDLLNRFNSKNIKFHGRVPELIPFMRECSIGIAPMFIASGIQNKVLEYLYSGLDVICSDSVLTGLSPRYTSGVTALPLDADAWINAILHSSYNPDARKKYSDEVAESHNWSNIASNFIKEMHGE